jgi:hypothetical protein
MPATRPTPPPSPAVGAILAAILILAAVQWLAVDGPVEGAVLLVVAPGRGLTVADLFAALPALLAVWVLRRSASGARRFPAGPRCRDQV